MVTFFPLKVLDVTTSHIRKNTKRPSEGPCTIITAIVQFITAIIIIIPILQLDA